MTEFDMLYVLYINKDEYKRLSFVICDDITFKQFIKNLIRESLIKDDEYVIIKYNGDVICYNECANRYVNNVSEPIYIVCKMLYTDRKYM